MKGSEDMYRVTCISRFASPLVDGDVRYMVQGDYFDVKERTESVTNLERLGVVTVEKLKPLPINQPTQPKVATSDEDKAPKPKTVKKSAN